MKRNTISTQRILSLILTVLILVASLPIATASALDTADNSQQIEYTGGWNPKEYPEDGTLYKDRVAVSKTIAPTELENYFDITLKVVAKPRVIDQSVDVVVVMDISNTMNSTHQGLGPNNAGYDIKDARLTHAKAAVDTFLDLYSVNQNISEDRRFGLVTFNSYANTVIPLTHVNTQEKAEELKATVDKITAPTENRVRFTNIEGGLQLAYNLLKESDAAFKYVIFITDGFPTTYIESGRNSTTQIVGYDTYTTGSYSASKVGTDGYFADSITKKVCTYGVNYSDKAADRADDVAAQIKASGINIFSIGVDVGVQSVSNYLSLATKTAHTTVDRTSSNPVIGNSTEAYRAWLSDAIAGGPMIEEAEDTEAIHRYASGNSSTEFTSAFTNILKDIELIPAETMEEAYTLDPMSDSVEFMYFYDLDGKPVSEIINTKHGRDVATFNGENKTIKWWLTTTQNFYIDEIGNYVLSMTYRVRLKNEAEDFNVSTALETNETTTFYFKTVDFTTGEPLFGDNSIDYPIPQVEGYKGRLSFTKVDAVSGNPLEGAEFTLQHYGDSCHVCHGDAVIADAAAESNRRGIVEFEDIPSGHEYVLIETKAPEGYKRGAHHSVNVAYGKTYLDSVLVTEEAPAVVPNDTIDPVEVQLSAHKNMIGREVTADEFKFSLTGVFEFGNRFHEVAACDENGMVTFHEIRFDQVGIYSFELCEIKGDDSSVIYDTKVYDIEIEVGLSTDGKSYTVTTTVDGEPVDNDMSPAPFEFTNKLREAGTAQLSAEKILDGEVPEDGMFEFRLKDEAGNVIDTKTTTNGVATFDEIEYTKEGVYRYTVSEEHNDELFDTVFFDHSVYNVLVTVTAPEGEGAFETKVEYFLDGEKTETPVFRNETRQEATLKLNFFKTLDGLVPSKDRFTFELRNDEGEVIQEVKNTELGVIDLDKLVFDKVGYFVYTVNEVIGTDDEIIYDKTIYSVYVAVEPHHNVSNYFLEVDVKKGVGEEEELVVHAHGINLDISTNGDLVFMNTTKEEPTEPTTVTDPTEVTTVTVPTEPTETDPTEVTTVTVPTEPTETDPTEVTTVTAPTEPTETDPTEVTTVTAPTEPTETDPTEVTTVTAPTEPTETDPTETMGTIPVTPPHEPTGKEPTAPTYTTVPEPETNITGATQEATEGKGPDAPNTGANNTLMWIAVMFVVGGGIVVIYYKRKETEK